jgi:hypothetical protein
MQRRECTTYYVLVQNVKVSVDKIFAVFQQQLDQNNITITQHLSHLNSY